MAWGPENWSPLSLWDLFREGGQKGPSPLSAPGWGPGFLEFVQVFWDFRAPYCELRSSCFELLLVSLVFLLFFLLLLFSKPEKSLLSM